MPPLPLVIRYVRKGGFFKIGSEELLQNGATDEQLDLIRTLVNLQAPYPVLYRVLASWGVADGLYDPQDAEREWWSSVQQSMSGPGSDYMPGVTLADFVDCLIEIPTMLNDAGNLEERGQALARDRIRNAKLHEHNETTAKEVKEQWQVLSTIGPAGPASAVKFIKSVQEERIVDRVVGPAPQGTERLARLAKAEQARTVFRQCLADMIEARARYRDAVQRLEEIDLKASELWEGIHPGDARRRRRTSQYLTDLSTDLVAQAGKLSRLLSKFDHPRMTRPSNRPKDESLNQAFHGLVHLFHDHCELTRIKALEHTERLLSVAGVWSTEDITTIATKKLYRLEKEGRPPCKLANCKPGQ